MKYWKVRLTRGHLGRGNNNGLITFYEIGTNALEAWDKARKHGGVKHSSLMNLNAEEISYEEYYEGRKTNAYVRACAKLG